MPMSRPTEAGFTLIELLVVLTVIGLLAAVATPLLRRGPGALSASRSRAELEQKIVSASTKARLSGVAVALPLTDLGSDYRFVPAIGHERAPLFYPDGSSNGGTIFAGDQRLLEISWLTGRLDRHGR